MDVPQSIPDRRLRLVTLTGWPFAFGLLLAHGLQTNSIVPSLGLLPMSISSFMGFLLLILDTRKYCGVVAGLDFFIAIFLFGVLMPSWFVVVDLYGERQAMLASYGTVPLMINFCIHLYLALRTILPRISLRRRTCPHCHSNLNRHITVAATGAQDPAHESTENISSGWFKTLQSGHVTLASGPGHLASSREIYQPLTADYDDDARESSEIETTPRPSAETLASSPMSKSAEALV